MPDESTPLLSGKSDIALHLLLALLWRNLLIPSLAEEDKAENPLTIGVSNFTSPEVAKKGYLPVIGVLQKSISNKIKFLATSHCIESLTPNSIFQFFSDTKICVEKQTWSNLINEHTELRGLKTNARSSTVRC